MNTGKTYKILMVAACPFPVAQSHAKRVPPDVMARKWNTAIGYPGRAPMYFAEFGPK